MDEEVVSPTSTDVLGFTDFLADAALTEKADARAEHVEQRVEPA